MIMEEIGRRRRIDMGLFKRKPIEQLKPILLTSSYNIAWVRRVCDVHSFVPNPNDKVVLGILSALNRNGGYCPCGGEIGNDDYKCPCINMRQDGECKCTLFIEIPKLESRNSISIVSAVRRNGET